MPRGPPRDRFGPSEIENSACHRERCRGDLCPFDNQTSGNLGFDRQSYAASAQTNRLLKTQPERLRLKRVPPHGVGSYVLASVEGGIHLRKLPQIFGEESKRARAKVNIEPKPIGEINDGHSL